MVRAIGPRPDRAALRELYTALCAALEERERLLERYYYPYRDWVEAQVSSALEKRQRILHISCHSFTPRLGGVERRTDIGLLYDPARASETRFCLAWQRELRAVDARWIVRRNFPYRGTADGLTTYLRSRFPDRAYSAIEIEVNQKYPLRDAQAWRALRKSLVKALGQTLDQAK